MKRRLHARRREAMETETLMLLLTLLGLLSEALPTRDDETEILATSSPARDAATEPEVGDQSVVAWGSPVSPGAHAHRSRGSAAPRDRAGIWRGRSAPGRG